MTFEDVLKLTRQRIGAIAVGLVIGIALSLVSLWLTPITYTASAVAYVRVSVPSDSEDQSRADSYYAASQLASQKVKAFVPVFTSEPVAQGVINTLGLATTPAELSGSITATSEKNALTINVSAVAPTAAEAQAVADETVRQADAQIRRLEGSRSPVGLVLMSPSSMSGATRSPSLPKHLGLGGLGGVVLGYLLAFTRNALDKRVRSQSDVASVVEEPVLAAIPRSASIARDERSEDHDHRAEEALRKLRTNLRYANIDKGLRTLIVSSALQGDGKSTVSANLARVMALSGQDVILMEGDLRRPTMKDTFRMGSHHPGLSQLLVGATSLERALVRTPVAGLQVIPAGDTPPNPSELLGSTRMSELLSYLAADHVVIIDAPHPAGHGRSGAGRARRRSPPRHPFRVHHAGPASSGRRRHQAGWRRGPRRRPQPGPLNWLRPPALRRRPVRIRGHRLRPVIPVPEAPERPSRIGSAHHAGSRPRYARTGGFREPDSGCRKR